MRPGRYRRILSLLTAYLLTSLHHYGHAADCYGDGKFPKLLQGSVTEAESAWTVVLGSTDLNAVFVGGHSAHS